MQIRERLRRWITGGKFWTPDSYESYVGSVLGSTGVSGGYTGLPYPFVEDSYTKILDTLQGGQNQYGMLRELTMENPFGFACLRYIAESIASIKWEACKIDGQGNKKVSEKHPVFALLQGDVHKRSQLSVIEPMVQHLHFGGELFIYMPVARSEGSMRPLSLELISPERFAGFIMKGKNEPKGFMQSISSATYGKIPMGGIVGYKFTDRKCADQMHPLNMMEGAYMYASVDQMVHMKRYNPKDEQRGMPMAWGARIPLIQMRMAAKWNTNLSKSGGRVVGFFAPKSLKAGKQITAEQREQIERDLDARLISRQDRNLPMVMSNSMEYLPNTVSPREADFLMNDKFNARKICSALGVPPILVGDVESVGLGGGSGTRSAEKSFFIKTVLPFLDDILEEFNLNIMPRFPGGYKLGYNRAEIEAVQEDLEKLWKRASTGCGGAFATPNDARDAVGLERLPDSEYDEIRGQDTSKQEMAEEEDNEDRNDRERQDDNPNLRILEYG